MLSVLLGMLHVKEKEAQTQFFSDDFDVTFQEAVEFMKERLALTPEEFYELDAKARFRAFTVARLTGLDAIERVKEKLTKAIEEGKTIKEWIEEMGEDEILKAVGFHQQNPWYLETVYRTNISTAYNAGRMMQIKRSKERIKYLEYVAIEDSRTTPICRRLDGTRLPPDDPFWSIYTPPNHFRCRSTVRAIFKGTEEARRVKERKPEELPELPEGFSASPVESWWKVVESMKRRLEKYGRAEEIKEKIQPLNMYGNILEIIDLPREKAVLFDDWGEVIWEKMGTKKRVDLSEIGHILENKIVTHNHPSGNPLSKIDIDLLISKKLKEIRAVGRKSGYVYRAWLTKKDITLQDKAAFVRYYEVAKKTLRNKAKKFYNNLRKQGFSYEEAQTKTSWEFLHWIWETVSEILGWLKIKR